MSGVCREREVGRVKLSGSRTKTVLSAAEIIALGFAAIIVVGALILSLPVSSSDGEFTSFSDCLFTSVSATCVTGLTVAETAEWSLFGKIIILVLIQIGGLGFMAMVFMISLVIRRAVSPREKLIFAQSMNLSSNESLTGFLRFIVTFAFSAEGIGAALLAVRFIPEFGVADGILKSLFHSVSAFCNAGFDTLPGSSLVPYADDVYLNVVIMCLIVTGGLGFIVWREITRRITRGEKLSVYARLVLSVTAVLIVGGAAFFYVSELNNPATIGGAGTGKAILRSLFQSVTFRTAGFNTVDLGAMTPISKLFSLLLMFIGGSSGSTAGGIKTVTFLSVIIAAVNILKGRNEVSIGRWEIKRNDVLRAFALTVTGVAIVSLSTAFISVADGVPIIDSAFEVFSAFGTVGVTVGITSSLGVASRILLMILMFFGRVGLFTVSFATLMRLNRDDAIRYPAAALLIG